MFNYTASVLTCLTACAILTNAQKYPVESDAVFNSPGLKHFIHVDILNAFPVNTATIYQVPNIGGNVTGAIEGPLVAVGSSQETLVPERTDIGLYENRFTINTTASMVFLDVRSTMTYANNALHGFGSATFTTDPNEDNEYANLAFKSFVVEIQSDFKAEKAVFDVFELHTRGRVDGGQIEALLPPGEA